MEPINFNKNKKSLILVTNKEFKKHARVFAHLISELKATPVSLYLPKMYEDNEAKITAKQHVIFLGKNKISESYVPLIKKHKKLGAIWGYDYSKAIIYVENDNEKKKVVLKEITRTLRKMKINKSILSELFKDYEDGYETEYWWEWIFTWWVWPLWVFLRKEQIKDLQFMLGILLFIDTCFDDFYK